MAAASEDQPQKAAAGDNAGGSNAAAPSTHFLFQHKVFSVPGAYFALAQDTHEPTYFVPLGDVQGVLTLPQLVSGFDIKPGSGDAALLGVVKKGLNYVRRIQPGDSIPREILDGSASWAVDDKHQMIAECRLRIQLASWLAGNETDVRDLTDLLKIADDPAIRDRVQDAVAELAEQIGLGRDRKAEVLERVGRLSRELSYIEALRDRFASLKMIGLKLVQLGHLYGPERGFSQEISRVLTLMRKPFGEYESIFRAIDARTNGIVALVRNFDAQVTAIRTTRDELHRRFMMWDELIPQWQELAVEMTPAAENLIRVTYRFTARQFPQSTDWELQFGDLGPRRS
jgi:hypothetical protein